MERDTTKVQCGCSLVILLMNVILGGWSVNLLLDLFGKNIPFFWDVVIGLILGQFTIPAALVVKILQMLGVI